MARIKLHYDGWLTLPAHLRAQLGLKSGDALEVVLVEDTLVLKPVAKGRSTAGPQTATAAASPEMEPTPVPGEAAEATPKPRRGRPPRTAKAEAPEPASLPAAAPSPSQLRKKTVPPSLDLAGETAPSPPGPGRRRRDEAGHRPADERRPFRQVELRKLGPGRGHNRRHRPSPGPAA